MTTYICYVVLTKQLNPQVMQCCHYGFFLLLYKKKKDNLIIPSKQINKTLLLERAGQEVLYGSKHK